MPCIERVLFLHKPDHLSSQPTLSTHPLNPPSQHTLSTHPLNPPSQHTLSTHPLNPPPQPTLSTRSLTPGGAQAAGELDAKRAIDQVTPLGGPVPIYYP